MFWACAKPIRHQGKWHRQFGDIRGSVAGLESVPRTSGRQNWSQSLTSWWRDCRKTPALSRCSTHRLGRGHTMVIEQLVSL